MFDIVCQIFTRKLSENVLGCITDRCRFLFDHFFG